MRELGRVRDSMRRAIQSLLSWYHDDEVEARHAETATVVRDAAQARTRAQNTIASYQASGRRMTRR